MPSTQGDSRQLASTEPYRLFETARCIGRVSTNGFNIDVAREMLLTFA